MCWGGFICESLFNLLALSDNLSRWEYITTIQFEWQIITGHRKYRWTVLVRSGDHIGLLSPPDIWLPRHVLAESYTLDAAFQHS